MQIFAILYTLHSSQVMLWGRQRAERLPCFEQVACHLLRHPFGRTSYTERTYPGGELCSLMSAVCFCKSANQIHVLSSFHYWGLCGLWLLNQVHIVPKYSNMVGAVCIVYFIRTWGLFSPKQLTDRNVPSKLPFRCLDCCLIFCQKGNTRL